VWIDNVNPFQAHQAGVLQSVDDLQQEVIAKWGDPAPRANKECLLDDEYVGVILHCRSDGGWARKDVFDAAGINIDDVHTYEELREAALTVSDPAKELWGWGITVNRSGDAQWLINRVLHGWGAYWVDETGQYVTINTPEAVTAVEWIVDTYTNPQWEPMLPPGVLSWTDTSNNESYLGGKVAYTQNAGTVYANAVVNDNPVAEVTVFHPPCGGPVLKEFNGLGGMYCHHILDSKNPTKARELIMSFFEDDVMNGMFQTAISYAVPAYEPQWDWEVIQSDRIAPQLKPVAMDPTGWNAAAFPGPSTAQMGAVQSSFIDTDLIANVLNGQMSAAESVQNAYDQAVAIFKEFGAPGEKA
jgi:multiple sugar transport system substrate-binding protein